MSPPPTNCYICKNTWLGTTAICDKCRRSGLGYKPPPSPMCSYCKGAHDSADCLADPLAAFVHNLTSANYRYMSKKTVRRTKPFANYYNTPPTPPLKFCSKCKGHTCIETKAGSICTSCKALTRNPCRNCTSTATHGLSGDNMQFIECNDCQFIE